MKNRPERIPDGIDHIALVMFASESVRKEYGAHLDEVHDRLALIGTCLNVLYQAATCHRKCHSSGHVLERLCGRGYNLACGAYQLSTFGLYDESLNLVRGLGELTNLVTLSAVDPPKIQEWISSGQKKRIREFSPVKVRLMLEAKGYENICADEAWYRKMSESYSHITPQTEPNMHGGAGFIGGKYEEAGVKETLGALLYVLTYLAMYICRYFQYDDLFESISKQLRTTTLDEEDLE